MLQGRRLSERLSCAAVLLLAAIPLAAAETPALDPSQVYTITVTSRYNVQDRQPRHIREFLAAHPNVRMQQWDGIRMPVQSATAGLAMAMAGNVGPDIFETDIRQAVSQGLAYPLTEWIGQDGVLKDGRPKLKADGSPNLNGQIDADEAKWDGWLRIKPLFRQVVTVDGIPWALPNRTGTYVGILYSKRLLRRAGLDPNQPPRTWDEFARWARKLYNRKERTPGIEFTATSWAFAPWVATTGSSIVVQDRISPTTGKVHTFNEQVTTFLAPDTGEDLQNVRPSWRCNVANPRCAAAVGFYHRLRWTPWIVDPATDEPVELTNNDRTRGRVEFRGRTIEFQPTDVYEGCLAVTTLEINDTIRRLGRTLALYPLWSGDMTEFENLGVDPSDMGMFPFPGMTEKEQPVLQASNWFFMVGKDVLHRGGKTPEERAAYRNLVWELMWRITSPEGADENIRKRVAAGQSRFLNPRDLLRLGFDDYAREIPSDNRKLWTDVEEGKTLEVVEPFMGKWLQFRDFYAREAIDLVLRPSGKEFDYTAALQRLEKEANSGTMFERPKEEIDRRRPVARVIAGLIAALLTFFTWLIFRGQFRKSASIAGVHARWAPWLMLAPALLSIGLWGYYPLARGLVMAFQEYRIGGDSPFVGLANFIGIYLDPNFYTYVFTTFRFVLWNLLLAFFTPIILAFLLAEVPRFKIFFRTLYFLPQMTSGLVVSLMWKEIYDGTPKGTLNQMLAFVIGGDFKAVDWLGNPQTVMACVILPGVWAGAGIGSLIYLAALKSVPDDLYEAASIDGAGIFSRIRHISLPTIAPLILINFVGAFIGTFQSMGSIFLLTFGGPGKETMVLSMAIWQEAYINLRFSLATSYAWILGAILISFTYFQLRLLRRVDFRQAKET